MAKNRVIELKAQDNQKRMEQLLFQQAQEREEVEQAHVLEYQDFNKQWDENMEKTRDEHEQMILGLEERHVKGLEENRHMLEEKLSMVPKASAELLNFRKIQANLARQKE